MVLDLSQLEKIRNSVTNYENQIGNYIEVTTDKPTGEQLKDNTDHVILKHVWSLNSIRGGGDKPISLLHIPNHIQPLSLYKLMAKPDATISHLLHRDSYTFLIDRRPFSQDKSIWKIAYIQCSAGSFVVVYDIFKDSFDYYHCISNDALYIDECTPIMDIKLKQELEAFAEENLILNLTPEYKQFMKKVYNGQITLED